jgi:hypothetical protein
MEKLITALLLTALLIPVAAYSMPHIHNWYKTGEWEGERYGNAIVFCSWADSAGHSTITSGYVVCPWP